MDEKRLEIKVGLLVLAAIAATLLLMFLMGELQFGRGGDVAVNFRHTGNVVDGAPVKLGGITVGRVTRTVLLPERRDSTGEPLPVEMHLTLDGNVRSELRTDAEVSVATMGPLGEAYLELHAGVAETRLPEGAPLRGVDAARLELVAQRMASFLDTIGHALEKNPELVAELISGVAGLTRTADDVLRDNRTQIQSLMGELGQAAKDFRVIAAETRVAMSPGGKATRLLDDAQATAQVLRAELPGLTKNAGRAMEGAAAISSQFNAQDGQRLKASLERMEKMAERGERIMSAIEAGQGSMGGFYKDPAVYQDLRALLADLKKHPWKVFWKD